MYFPSYCPSNLIDHLISMLIGCHLALRSVKFMFIFGQDLMVQINFTSIIKYALILSRVSVLTGRLLGRFLSNKGVSFTKRLIGHTIIFSIHIHAYNKF